MKRLVCGILSGLLFTTPVISWAATATDAEVDARRAALEVAGAFSNDGFKLRDGVWVGKLESGKPRLIQVNLYAGNEYWFTVGTASGVKRVAVSIFDEAGKAVEFEPYAEGSTAAAGFSPEVSGPYIIKVEELEGEPSSFALIYSYK